jgi:hypothetical protein
MSNALALPGLETESVRGDDIVLTPRHIAKAIVERFKPYGRVLDPCRGNGAFSDVMPGCDTCEIRDGQDFFAWSDPVDWIVSNPPYSIYSDFLRHSFKVAREIVYLIPINKAFNSDRMMREVQEWGGIPTIYVIGSGGSLNFPIGFAIGAVHYSRGYRGGTMTEFHKNQLL